jgi:hypothetical protein
LTEKAEELFKVSERMAVTLSPPASPVNPVIVQPPDANVTVLLPKYRRLPPL